jgi:hypothetical protein
MINREEPLPHCLLLGMNSTLRTEFQHLKGILIELLGDVSSAAWALGNIKD